MKKFKILLIVASLLVSAFAFTGCSEKNVLYHSWQMQATIDAETKEETEPMFANMMVFTINKDGTVDFLDDVFGTYEKDRNEFVFTYVEDEDDPESTPEPISGGWEIIGNELYIYPDTDPVIYKFAAVETKEESN